MTPEGWKTRSLREACSEIYRYPSFYGMEKPEAGIPVIRGEHINNDGTISTDWSDYWHVSSDLSDQYPRTKVAVGDIVMSVRGTVGRYGQVGPEHVEAQVSPNLIRLSPNKTSVSPEYFFYALEPAVRLLLSTSVAATTISSLRASDIQKAHILLPPLPEQKKIAAILGSVDEAIQATQAVIDQTRKVKQGLLAQLLTRGIGHTRFKKTEIGEIPEEWEVTRVGDVSRFQSGFPFKSNEFSRDGDRLLRGSNVGVGRLVWDVGSTCFFPTVRREEFSEYVLYEGDIIVAMDRPFISEGFKIARVTSDDVPALLLQRVGRFREYSGIERDYLWFLLQSSYVMGHLQIQQKGTDLPHISKSEIEDAQIPLPPDDEQKAIVAILTSIESEILESNRVCESLKRQKMGLMQDLLTGRIRVMGAA